MASFQLDEINKAAPSDGEDERLETERAVLTNADRLARLSTEAFATLYDGDDAALARLAGVWKRVGRAGSDRSALHAVSVRARRDQIQPRRSRDVSALVHRGPRGVARAAAGRRGSSGACSSASSGSTDRRWSTSLRRRDELAAELAALGASEERVEALTVAERETRGSFYERAVGAVVRAPAVPPIVSRGSSSTRWPSWRCRTRAWSSASSPPTDPEAWTRQGIDAAEFLLSSNAGEDPRPLARIASGGELSRVMLALRTIVEREEAERTLVFDEVDAGIGGAAADAVGLRLQRLGRAPAGALYHAPAANRRETGDALSRLQGRSRGTYDYTGHETRRRRPRAGDRPYDRRRRGHAAGSGVGEGADRETGEWRNNSKSETRLRRAAGESERSCAWGVSTSSRRSAAR